MKWEGEAAAAAVSCPRLGLSLCHPIVSSLALVHPYGSLLLLASGGGNSEAFLGDIAEEDVDSNADLSELIIPRDVDESEAHEIVNKAYAKKLEPEG